MTLDIRDLHKRFGTAPALDGIDLSVGGGEFMAILGPSGSGKTTLLRVVAGLDFPDRGTIAIGDRPMTDVPARQRGVGMVFQNYALFRHMTVARNIAFGLEVRHDRPSRSAIRDRVAELLDLMGIPELADRYPYQVSGGQRQRVALARALAIEPLILLLDEPFGALDAKVRKNLRVWLRGLHDRMGLTTLMVTHDQNEALEMADRVAVMRDGRIEQVDTPDRLYREPANGFVHEFLGDSVRLDCVVSNGAARFPGLCASPVLTSCPDGPAIALLRAHEIVLLPGPGSARVETVHAAGAMAKIRMRIAEQVIEALLPESAVLPKPGDTCRLDLSRARIYPAAGA